jgi:protein tyrosine phosphatase (PTP) superfamily phosphohydrolase (DUF442 family)
MDNDTLAGIYRYRAIDDQLSTSGQPNEAQLAALVGAGFEVVINLALHDDPRYSLRDEPGTVRSLGMEYVHIPVPFDAPTEEQLLQFFSAMERHRGRRILVHCAANLRVSAFLGLYRALRLQWPQTDAFGLMHSLWQPNPTWSSFIATVLAQHEHK